MALFRQCAQFQLEKDLDRYVAVVVLDEVGLAEDSPRMPLKSLHAMLETGYEDDGATIESQKHAKVGFVGLSNWALDPAKMNRGIMVQRDLPSLVELEETARGICSRRSRYIDKLIEPLASAYTAIIATECIFDTVRIKREFFGLRDFYSLVKMVQALAEENRGMPTKSQMKQAVLRNFGGLDIMDPYEICSPYLDSYLKEDTVAASTADCTPAGMIKDSLTSSARGQSRYLLLLTENLSMANMLQHKVFKLDSAITIYGSSFPNDLDFTQVCRNINKIKICMETGNTVILLNLENIYESLYDALNQYYSKLGLDRFVDIGLGTHRTKCKVHSDFRLIVVSEKKTVYEKYPIPLINRLEKHFINVETLLLPRQIEIVNVLKKWAEAFCEQRQTIKNTRKNLHISEVFRGYHDDACAAIVICLWEELKNSEQDRKIEQDTVLDNGKKMLLWCATPESIVRAKTCALTKEESTSAWNIYWEKQAHGSFSEYVNYHVKREIPLISQVTTHSKLLSTSDKTDLASNIGLQRQNIFLESLESFDTEQQFILKIR